ncbi:MAG: flagellar export protein FliJ [Pseudomonadota bacterium]
MSGVSNMKARDVALRLKKFEAEEKSKKVSDLEQMIAEFQQMADDLELQVQAEEDRTGVKDASHFAYSTFARSAGQRRDNLHASINDLKDRLALAVVERDEAMAQIGEADMLQNRVETGSGRTRPAHAR